MLVRACAVVAALLGVGAAGAAEPGPLHGAPLTRETGLRLVVAAKPPFVLDVDSGRVTRLAVPSTTWPLSVADARGRGAVVVVEDGGPRSRLYGVRAPGRVVPLGRGSEVRPAGDGSSVWVQSVAGRRRCTVRQVALDGRVLRAPRPLPCATASDPAGALGLVVGRTRVVDPRTGRVVARAGRGILAVAGTTLVLAGPGKAFALLDTTTRAERTLPWPSVVGGRDGAVVDPSGRFVALGFGDPAWHMTGDQVEDVWVLDTRSAELTQLPGMPAFVALKATSITWTRDGRLVLLAQTREGRDVVAVWRPGDAELAVKAVRLPDRDESGSDTFAVIG